MLLLFVTLFSLNGRIYAEEDEDLVQEEETLETLPEADAEETAEEAAEDTETIPVEEEAITEELIPEEQEWIEEELTSREEEAAEAESSKADTTYAYAVLQSNGKLIFTRSANTYSNAFSGKLVDRNGNSYKGIIFSDVENTRIGYDCMPWNDYLTQIQEVRAVDTIKPAQMYNWFAGAGNLKSFYSENFDTSATQYMTQIFMDCENLTYVDLSHFDTSNVESMAGLFRSCKKLTSIDLRAFNTSKVQNMEQMFYMCEKLTDLNISSFNTSKVWNMATMFSRCKSLEQLDLSHFDTSAVTVMYDMFEECESMVSLNVSNFDTSNAQYMYGMFYGMKSITELDLSSFRTAAVDTESGSSMSGFKHMFTYCKKLQTLDISGFDTSGVQNMEGMFDYCYELSTVKLGKGWTRWISNAYLPSGNWMSQNVDATRTEEGLYNEYPSHSEEWAGTWVRQVMAYAVLKSDGTMVFARSGYPYYNDTEDTLQDINGNTYTGRIFADIENTSANPPWKAYRTQIRQVYAATVIKPKSMRNWFSGASQMWGFDGTNIDTSETLSMYQLFDGCTVLMSQYLDISGFDTKNVKDMYGMFYVCRNLSYLDLSHFDTSSLEGRLTYMFKDCQKLERVDMSSFDTSRITDMFEMFSSCLQLKEITFSNKFVTSNVTSFNSMFSGCQQISYLDLSSFDTSSATDMTQMFANCFALDTIKLGKGWTKWLDNSYLPVATWYHEDLAKDVTALYNEYPVNAEAWAGTWTRRIREVTRLAGKNRYDTSLLAAEELMSITGVSSFDAVVLTTGDGYADALSGSYLAIKKKAPVLLINESKAKKVRNFIANNLTPGGVIYVLGGESSVSSDWIADIAGDYTVERVEGSSRYGTNLEVLKTVGVDENVILVASGESYADSLSASATGLPLLLVTGNSLKGSQKRYLEELMAERHLYFVILGGTNSVSAAMEESISAYGTIEERLYGSNRYFTSDAIADYFFPRAKKAVIAWGENFPDGLSAGVLGYFMDAPLLLTNSKKANTTKKYTSPHNIHDGIVMGGTGNLPDDLVRNILELNEIDVITVKSY